jgi:hypothetical protein
MNKITYGRVLGGILGLFDGLMAWFTPEVRPQLIGIVFGSMVKGLLAGVLIGVFAHKVYSLALGVLFGLGVSLLFAFLLAHLQGKYYLQIMLPGGLVGLIVGYATQKYRDASAISPSRTRFPGSSFYLLPRLLGTPSPRMALNPFFLYPDIVHILVKM